MLEGGLNPGVLCCGVSVGLQCWLVCVRSLLGLCSERLVVTDVGVPCGSLSLQLVVPESGVPCGSFIVPKVGCSCVG